MSVQFMCSEIEAAKTHSLPDLITLKDIKGDLHVHTNAFDGSSVILQLAEVSKSYSGEPVCETIVAGDIDGDCTVDFRTLPL